jgi:5'-nucleotidase
MSTILKTKPRFRTISLSDKLPPYNTFVPTIDSKGNFHVYRLIKGEIGTDYWNLRDTAGIYTPPDNNPILFWLEEVKVTKKTIYIDLDGVCADYKKQWHKKKAEDPELAWPQATYGFFMEMEQIKDAVSAVKTLNEHYDVMFLSAPSSRNPMCLAEKNYWIRINFGPEWVDKLILCNEKQRCIGDYLIDDNATGRGQDTFEGELILFGDKKFPTWYSVLEYLFLKDFAHENISWKN